MFIVVNGDHEMTRADDEYCRRLYIPLHDAPDCPVGRLLELISTRSLPLPSYVLSDGTFMVHRDYLDPVRAAGGPQSLRAWFLGHWDESEQDVALTEWEGYLSGQYVCLYSVTPDTIKAKARLIEQIKSLTARLDEAKDDIEARAALVQAVDELDDIEPPFTAYDRLRFHGPLSREVWIDAIRADYLADHDEYRMTFRFSQQDRMTCLS
jgi:hypothetical protein